MRVYPDECLVDTFEPSLTEEEVANAQAFWASIWRAGGVEAEELAAWRELAASHGAGRAGWIVKHYTPLNPGDKPEKAAATDILLIIAATAPVPAQAAAFWQNVWRDGGTDAAIAARRPALEAAAGAAAAAADHRALPPVNLGDPPVEPRDAGEHGGQRHRGAVHAGGRDGGAAAVLVAGAARDAAAGAAGADRVIGGADSPRGGRRAHPTPLAAGPDPNAPEGEQLRPEGDELASPRPSAGCSTSRPR